MHGSAILFIVYKHILCRLNLKPIIKKNFPIEYLGIESMINFYLIDKSTTRESFFSRQRGCKFTIYVDQILLKV